MICLFLPFELDLFVPFELVKFRFDFFRFLDLLRCMVSEHHDSHHCTLAALDTLTILTLVSLFLIEDGWKLVEIFQLGPLDEICFFCKDLRILEVLNAIWMLVDVEWNHVNLRGGATDFGNLRVPPMVVKDPLIRPYLLGWGGIGGGGPLRFTWLHVTKDRPVSILALFWTDLWWETWEARLRFFHKLRVFLQEAGGSGSFPEEIVVASERLAVG